MIAENGLEERGNQKVLSTLDQRKCKLYEILPLCRLLCQVVFVLFCFKKLHTQTGTFGRKRKSNRTLTSLSTERLETRGGLVLCRKSLLTERKALSQKEVRGVEGRQKRSMQQGCWRQDGHSSGNGHRGPSQPSMLPDGLHSPWGPGNAESGLLPAADFCHRDLQWTWKLMSALASSAQSKAINRQSRVHLDHES